MPRPFAGGGGPSVDTSAREVTGAGESLPQSSPKALPITIGVGEPFTVSITVAFYFALLISLPILLYQAYAFVIPAMRPNERRVAMPIMIVAPVLFAAGAVFTYIVVLPAAVKFLQGYNSTQFQNLDPTIFVVVDSDTNGRRVRTAFPVTPAEAGIKTALRPLNFLRRLVAIAGRSHRRITPTTMP